MISYLIPYGVDVLIFLTILYWFHILKKDYKKIIFMIIIYLTINIGLKIILNHIELNTILVNNLLTMTISFFSSLLLSITISTNKYKAILLTFFILFISHILESSLTFINIWYIDFNRIIKNFLVPLVIPIIILLDKFNYLSFQRESIIINMIFITILSIIRVYYINEVTYGENTLIINMISFIIWTAMNKFLTYKY